VAREPVERPATPAQNTSAPPTSPTTPPRDAEQASAGAVPAPERAAEPAVTPPQEADAAQAKHAALQAGTLLVAFEGGWAEVYLGAKLLGTTPGRFELPAGRQTLIVKPFGAETGFKRRVDVEPATVTKLFLSASQP
jgi:hypothetical protein